MNDSTLNRYFRKKYTKKKLVDETPKPPRIKKPVDKKLRYLKNWESRRNRMLVDPEFRQKTLDYFKLYYSTVLKARRAEKRRNSAS